MEDLKEKKKEFILREKQYYKPHFGPEENEENIMMERERMKNQKYYVNQQLQSQIGIKNQMIKSHSFMERVTDEKIIKNALEAQEVEK